MARPLKYDDQFRNIISSNLNSAFIFCIKLKVPTTIMQGKYNLQTGLKSIGIIDLIFFAIFIIFHNYKGNIPFIEKFLLYSTGPFGLVALDVSKNLKKINSSVYYYWRIVMLFTIPCYELSNHIKTMECYVLPYCNGIVFAGITLVYIGISLYLTKVAWAFSIQMANGNELLILHGKYLEQMLNDENLKIEQRNICIPPNSNSFSLNKSAKDFIMHNNNDEENVGNFKIKQSNDVSLQDNKKLNPFREALITLGKN